MFGIEYEKLESVKRLRNIIAPYSKCERNEIIKKLNALDDGFLTSASEDQNTSLVRDS